MQDIAPSVLDILTAVGPLVAACATLIVGLAVATVAYRQWETAQNQWHTGREKLVLDLFQRRFEVYQRAFDAAHSASLTATINKETVEAMSRARDEAKFLFENDVVDLIGTTCAALMQWYTAKLEDSPDLGTKAIAGITAASRLVYDLPQACIPYMRMTQKL